MILKNRENLVNKRGMVRLIYGEDGFRARERLRFYTDAFSRQYDPRGLNIERFYSPDFKIEELHSSLNTPPLFAPKRLFIIYNFSRLKLDDGKEDVILKDIGNLKDNSIIFLEEIDDKTFKKISFYKKFKLNSVENFPQLKGFYLEKEVRERFEKQGYKIEPSALRKFLLLVGNDFWKINSEMEKLIAYISSLKKKAILLKDVESVTSVDFADNCFVLIDFFIQKNKKGAAKELQNLRYSGIDAATIFHQVGFNFRQLLETKFLIEEKKFNSTIVSEILSIHPYRAQKLCQSARNFTLEELKKIHNSLIDTDFKIKTGKLKSDTALDLFLTKIL